VLPGTNPNVANVFTQFSLANVGLGGSVGLAMDVILYTLELFPDLQKVIVNVLLPTTQIGFPTAIGGPQSI